MENAIRFLEKHNAPAFLPPTFFVSPREAGQIEEFFAREYQCRPG